MNNAEAAVAATAAVAADTEVTAVEEEVREYPIFVGVLDSLPIGLD